MGNDYRGIYAHGCTFSKRFSQLSFLFSARQLLNTAWVIIWWAIQ